MMLYVSLEWPSVIAWLMALRSIARLAARRTRRSCQGDFGSHWSSMLTHCGAWITVAFSVSPGVRCISSASSPRIEYTMSTSPRFNAASRVASSEMTLKTSRFTLVEGRGGGALVALERELDVLGGERVAVVELHAFAEREVVHAPVRRDLPRLRQAGGGRVPGHRLGQRVVDRVHHHEWRNDPQGLGGIEPRRRERDVNAPRQLALGGGRRGRGNGEQNEQGAGGTSKMTHRSSSSQETSDPLDGGVAAVDEQVAARHARAISSGRPSRPSRCFGPIDRKSTRLNSSH